MSADVGLVLELFGAPRMRGRGAEESMTLLTKPKTFALLVYLALAGPDGFRRREDLLARFWPESDSTRARNALRQSLFLLKGLLPNGALSSRGQDEVGLRSVVVDVIDFEACIANGLEREALALYAGPFLEGFRLYGSSDFDAWAGLQRKRLQHRAVQCALSFAKRGADGDEDSDRWIRWAIDHAPYDENLLRDAMALLHARRDAGGAARLYLEAAERYRTDLGIALSPETEREARMAAAASQHAVIAPVLTIRRSRRVTPEARRLHLQARQFAAQRSPVTILKAIDGFERAISLCPDYAEAHAGLGFALCQAVVYVDYPGADAWPRAKAHALRASRLDPALGEALAVLAHVTLCYDYDWAEADALYRRALGADPLSAAARQLYPLYYLTSVGRVDDALEFLDRARDDMPENPHMSVYYAMCCVFGRRFDRAHQETTFILDTHPALVQAHWVRGMALEGLGDLDGAVASFETGVTMTGRSSLLLSQLGRALASQGCSARARCVLHELDQRGDDSGPALYNSAEILAALGDHDEALDRLYRAYRQRNPFMIFAGVKYGLDPLRGTRRFRDLLTRMGVPAHLRAVLA